VRKLALLLLMASVPTGLLHAEMPPILIDDVPSRGRTVEVVYIWNQTTERYPGELIAVTPDSLLVLGRESEMWIPKSIIIEVQISKHDLGAGRFVGWMALGVIGSLSHGWGAILTVPLWLIVGTITSITVAVTNDFTLLPDQWDELRQYSRFPQGLPAEFQSGTNQDATP